MDKISTNKFEITEIIHLLDFNEIEEADKDSNFEDSNIINDKSNNNVEVIIEWHLLHNDSDNELESNSKSEDYNYNPNEIAKDIYNNNDITDDNYNE
ncbi:hypothetical protein RhiirA5_415572 [Rhizophagus irregularis]|uniref:Uncharacterized protein n=1 Tax=Rhizophagus irregularis TaxID=588596 RepID=A0A2N1NV34_9GLOM|nr:hypothetical protein RhiirA5_415572 [Rhizophagus irregularis]PKK77753.1 hypothetical protein RhiirC2_771008 [Rhizophagus irregularis]